ncbi:hypothetical protein [Bradyrhizobium nanningense]|nr:hypothetical protein [Bradyrhizobium nanningense]
MVQNRRQTLAGAVAFVGGAAFSPDVAVIEDFGSKVRTGRDDTEAIKSALNSGTRFIAAAPNKKLSDRYSISETIHLPPGVSFDGRNIPISTKEPIRVLSVDADEAHGNREGEVNNLIIDGGRRASCGLYVGLAVHRTFRNITVRGVSGDAIIVDAGQNNLFENLNTEDCQVALRLCNGAANNLFVRCSFSDASLRNIILGRSPELGGARWKMFDNHPCQNTFERIIAEYGRAEIVVDVDSGRFNSFRDIVISGGGRSGPSLRLGKESSLNHFDRPYVGGGGGHTGVLQEGFGNSFDTPIFEGFANGSTVLVSRGQTRVSGFPHWKASNLQLKPEGGGRIMLGQDTDVPSSGK